jgi:regulator of protease activity HflC (stomatin/prohibitin superfamily)
MKIAIFLAAAVVAVACLLSLMMWGLPQYNIYTKRLSGQAQYEMAEQDRRIRVLEAQASFDSASLTAKAEIERAKGVAEANKIIANSLGGAEGYLRWRYIEMLEQKGGHDVIYLPTEAGLPILEANRLKQFP